MSDFFDKLDRSALQSYVDFMLRQYRLMDAYWFLEAENEFGLAKAEEFNEHVWEIMGSKGARDILRRFRISDKGLQAFLAALQYYPWTHIIGYEIETSESQILITVPSCPPQVARLKQGLGEYKCKEMHRREFCAFANAIDPSIQVDCLFAPPGPRPKGAFCKWRFAVADA